MANQVFKIPRASDASIVSAYKEIVQKYEIPSVTINAVGDVRLGQINLLGDLPEVFETLLKNDNFLIDHINTSFEQTSISYFRSGREKNSPFWDEIEIAHQNENTARILWIVALLRKKYLPVDLDRTVSGQGVDELKQLSAMHASVLERLELTNEKLLSETQKYRVDLDRQFVERKAELEKSLNEQALEMQRGVNDKEEGLRKKEEQVDARIKTIDDRDNTHARRDTRERLLKDVHERVKKFDLSSETRKKRWPVAIAIYVMAFVFLLFAIFSALEIKEFDTSYNEAQKKLISDADQLVVATKDELPAVETKFKYIVQAVPDKRYEYWLWVRLSLLSFGFFGTILYYIKWQNNWAQRHADTEFNLQKFYIDVNRANWAVESGLEWFKVTNTAMPNELLKSVTHGLFEDRQSEPEQVIHPADTLASALMGTASKLKLNLNGQELEFNKPGKIKKTISTGGEE